jgi:GDPmannose 4,6-dehydratase
MTRPPTALVTGAAGQDGSYLVERLVADGYAVHGLVRPGAAYSWPVPTTEGAGSTGSLTLHEVDVSDLAGLGGAIDEVEPDEIHNLAGVSSVARSWADPVGTARVTGVAAVEVLTRALALQERTGRQVRVLQASSAEIFGEPVHSPQTEATPIRPVSPYGAAKALAHHSVDVFRRRGLFAASAILYNHESPRRPTTFVTRKITTGVARIAREGGGTLALGNLDARRDWGWAPDHVDAMVRAIRHDEPDDFVVATGQAHSVRDFVALAFRCAGVEDWEKHVVIDPAHLRPVDPSVLVGDPRHAERVLGWRRTRDFAKTVAAMVFHDLQDSSTG